MDFAENLASINARIASACARVDRSPASVGLVAVSKGHGLQRVEEAVAAGVTLFGESKVQEAKAKIGRSSSKCRWHMIGHLQSNKARDAVHFFNMIESVDSLPLAEEINKWADKSAKYLPVLLEVNVAGESSKFGYKPETLLRELANLNDLKRLEIAGLMTIAPWTQEAEKARPIFRQLRELKQACEQILGAPLAHLSMGMSGDFEIAIEEGATLVRIGTALFGERPRFGK